MQWRKDDDWLAIDIDLNNQSINQSIDRLNLLLTRIRRVMSDQSLKNVANLGAAIRISTGIPFIPVFRLFRYSVYTGIPFIPVFRLFRYYVYTGIPTFFYSTVNWLCLPVYRCI